jgi:RHS repeat-associated protein
MIKNGVTYRILVDQVGSVRLVFDVATGKIAQRMDYDEFGNILSDSNPGFQPFGFGGDLYDRDTTLVRFGVRDYDPRTGRWTAKDTIFFASGGTNLYAYTGGSC